MTMMTREIALQADVYLDGIQRIFRPEHGKVVFFEASREPAIGRGFDGFGSGSQNRYSCIHTVSAVEYPYILRIRYRMSKILHTAGGVDALEESKGKIVFRWHEFYVQFFK